MLSDKTIFIIDDEREIADLLADLVRSLGCSAQLFLRAEDALAQLSRQTPFLVLTDYRMRGMDGIEFTKELKKRAPGVPVVLITGCTDQEVLDRASRNGIDECFEKPFSHRQLRQSIQRYLKDRASQSASA